MALPWYATRERVKTTMDAATTPRMDYLIDQAIGSASRSVDDQMSRTFYPVIATHVWPWPNDQYARPWELWLDNHELVSLTALTSGGIVIPASDYLLEPSRSGPPYNRIDINLSTQSGWTAGQTWQRSISVIGIFAGCPLDTEPAGALAEALDASETGVDVTDSAAIGIGDLIFVDSEDMIVTGRAQLTTGQTLQTPLTASVADALVAVTTGSAFSAGEMITLDAERMLITDITGNNLVVKRAVDGSVLTTHIGSTIYAPRTLTVERGALGSTAASHLISAPITRHVPPDLVTELTTAEAINAVLQKVSGYARMVGSGDNARPAPAAGIRDIRDRCAAAHGRKMRTRAV